MIKKSIFILSLLLLLAACSQEETNEPVEEGRETDDVENVVTMPETEEEWLALSIESKWNEKQNLSNVEFGEPIAVNFDGDSIPEVVTAYSPTDENVDKLHGYLIGKYDEATGSWNVWQNVELENMQSIEALDKITFENNFELLVTKEADKESKTALGMYRLSKEDNKVIDAARTNVDADKEVVFDSVQESIRYYNNDALIELKLENNQWLVGKDRKLYLKSTTNMFQEAYWDVIGDAPIRELPVTLGASYEETKQALGETKEEFGYEGGLCADYESFFFCKEYFGKDEVVHITSKVPNEVIMEDFKAVLGEPDSEGFNELNEVYSFRYELGDIIIILETISEDPKSNIDQIIIVPKVEI